MENDCKFMEFLQLFAQVNVIPVIHYAFNRQQLRTTGNDFRQTDDFLSLTVSNRRWFSASRLWICI